MTGVQTCALPIFALILMAISITSLVQTDIIAFPVADKLGKSLADTRFTIRFLGFTILFLSGTLLIASIGLFFKNNICRKIAIIINVGLWILAFPVAISLFLSENNVKALFNHKEQAEHK